MNYTKSFYLTERVGNNAFAWDERGGSPKLYVPSRKKGTVEEVQVGEKVVFSDVDEELKHCRGLKNFIELEWNGVPTLVVDNHNHVFYFWYEALERGLLAPGATMIHVDQHKDMRPAPEAYIHEGLDSAFHYTNQIVNVGNYIRPAMDQGLIADVQLVTGETALDDRSFLGRGNKILNIDLDFFAPELETDFEKAKAFILEHLKEASLVTIATSPFFIDQELALKVLRDLLN